MLNKRPLGLIIFGVLLVTTSLVLLYWLPGYDLYRQVNHEWPESIIRVRYVGSYIYRLLGLACGIGILCRKEPFRKVFIGLSYYSLATLALRHTYSSQLFFSEPIYHANGSTFSLETFTWIAVIIHWLVDGIFSLAAILYFRNPKVKGYFKQTQE
jgi:hypothetical protein